MLLELRLHLQLLRHRHWRGWNERKFRQCHRKASPAAARHPHQPTSRHDHITSSNQIARITWSPVSGAVGYILYRANSANGPFNFPGNYIQSMVTTNYTDGGLS